MDSAHYYRDLALAYLRGKLPRVSCDEDALLAASKQAGLRLNRFKRTIALPRVRKVIGILKSFGPDTLLDIGTGRGVFLWPLLDELDTVDVTCIDVLEHRVADLDAVARGGVNRLRALQMDAAQISWPANHFDAVTALEVLEHVPDPATVARQLVGVARTVVVATVPSKEDNNPEHIRVFDRDTLSALFRQAQAREVRVEHVLNHLVAIARP